MTLSTHASTPTSFAPTDSRATAWISGKRCSGMRVLKTSEQGAATVEFALNDSVTTFRVFADAFTAAGAIGSGSTCFRIGQSVLSRTQVAAGSDARRPDPAPRGLREHHGVRARPGEYDRRYGIFGDLALTRSNHDTGRLRPP